MIINIFILICVYLCLFVVSLILLSLSSFLLSLSSFLFTISSFWIKILVIEYLKARKNLKSGLYYLVFGVCSPDFSVGAFGGAFLPHAEIKGANKIAATHIKTRLFLRIFFITSQYQFFRKNLILSKTVKSPRPKGRGFPVRISAHFI